MNMTQPNKPLLPPKKLYQNVWVLITTYGNYDITENIYNLPELWSNVSSDMIDLLDPAVIAKCIIEEIHDAWEEGYNKDLQDKNPDDVTFYYITFTDEDEFDAVHEIIDGYLEEPDKSDMVKYQFQRLINALGRQKEIKPFKL